MESFPNIRKLYAHIADGKSTVLHRIVPLLRKKVVFS